MFKFVSQKEYDRMIKLLEEQTDQVERLISLCSQFKKQAKEAEEKYVNLVRLLYEKQIIDLPEEAVDLLKDAEKLIEKF